MPHRVRDRLDQKSMPPMPPPPWGIPPPPAFFLGSSATMASVVIRSAATDAAFWIATRTTLVGSMIPLEIRLTYSPVCESNSVGVLVLLEDLTDDDGAVLARVDRDLAGRI